ncbi:MAG: exosortase [Nitrospiraceae bacterium]|nr:MAG: exosortase [Nitrospiraceae bacterium]
MKNYKRIHIVPVIFSLIAFGFLYWDTAYKVVLDWYNDENYSHGFLIPFISGYLLWQKKDNLKSAVITPSNWGLLILFSGLVIFLIGNLSGESFSMRLSMLVVLAGAVIFSFGPGFFKAVSFPFIYLVFMIPMPYLLYDSVAFPLKLFVSKFSVEFLSLTGVLVLREGNIIHLAGTTLEVADACSGIRSVVSLLALSTALAYLTQKGRIKKFILVVLAVPIAVFVNALRIIGTGVLADRHGAAAAEGFFHEFGGLMIFGVAIALLILSAVVLGKVKSKG